MAIVAIRKNVWDAASNSQHSILSLAMAALMLGTPAVYRDGGQEWYVWSDWRMTLGQVATWGMLVKGLAGLPRDWKPTMVQNGEGEDVRVDRAATEASVNGFVKDDRVHPRDVEYDETVTVQVPDRERRTVTDEDGNVHEFWFDLGTTHGVDVVQAKGNPWQVTLEAQGAPAGVKAFAAVPADWEAVTDGE